MCTYNATQFIHSRKWENVKRESFEYFLVLKKKKKKSLYNTISHHHYRSNRCATPIFHESTPISFLYALCAPPPIVVPRSTNTSNVSPSLIGESERDIPWKVKKLARRELGMHTGNGIRYGGHFAHSMYHGPKMDCRGNASWIPFIFRNRPRF